MKDELQRAIAKGQVKIIDDDRDLDVDPITLPDGTVLDNAAAERLGDDVGAQAVAKRGRPSLTAPGQHSPRVTARVHPDVKASVEAVAERDGKRPTDIVREAIEEYLAVHA